jgi:ubiquinone/menaquinone biosynthesis C-methylase UbiE
MTSAAARPASLYDRLLREHNERITAHFDGLAARYDELKDRNRYYNHFLGRWCRSCLAPGQRILDIGCGRGDVLAELKPASGVGIDVSKNMVEAAAAEFPHLSFRHIALEDFDGDASFDAALLINTAEYTFDMGAVIARCHRALRDNGRLLLTTANPLWSPIFHFASRLGLRIPECERLFLTNEDLVNLLRLNGFDVVYKRMSLLIPKHIPLFSDFINNTWSRLPILHLLSSTQLIVARKVPVARREYSVSIVVPCYNERGNIERCIREVPPIGSRTELLFVDDGSKDGTAEAVDPALNQDIDVRVIRYTPNHGKGHAVKTGFDAATGDIVMILDADLTTMPEELSPIYDAFAAGHAEFVNGTRFIYPMEGRAMKWANYVGNKMFNILVSHVMESRVSDTLCGTKAMFRRNYISMEMGRDPWGDYDFLFGAAQQRLVIRELPVHYRQRLAGFSKMNSLKHTLNLLRMCWHGFFQVKMMRPLENVNLPTANARASVGKTS